MKCRVLLFFCSNPDALGIDGSEKGIYDALKKIAKLPPSPPRVGDRLVDSAAGTRERVLRLKMQARSLLLALVS